MKHPYEIHWKVAKNILQYVQGTKSFRVHYATSSPLELVGFSYSNWVGDPNNKNSTSGLIFMLDYGPIFWSSKKRHSISLSSAESKYRGAVNATTQCVWLQDILRELGVAFDLDTII